MFHKKEKPIFIHHVFKISSKAQTCSSIIVKNCMLVSFHNFKHKLADKTQLIQNLRCNTMYGAQDCLLYANIFFENCEILHRSQNKRSKYEKQSCKSVSLKQNQQSSMSAWTCIALFWRRSKPKGRAFHIVDELSQVGSCQLPGVHNLSYFSLQEHFSMKNGLKDQIKTKGVGLVHIRSLWVD